MDEAIKSLVVTVKETLKDFTAGRLSSAECRQRYKRISTECDSLQYVGTRHRDLLSSLCYLHSTENFSLFTGLYRLDMYGLTALGSSGDDGFNLGLLRMRDVLSSRLAGSTPVSLAPGDGHELPHTVHACVVPGESSMPLLFTAVSSSNFFSSDEFLNTAELIGVLRSAAELETRPQYFSFFGERRARINEWIRRTLAEGGPVSAHYFLFNMVERIFSHMGLPEMLKVSASIKKALMEQCGPPDTPVFELSMREYLMFIPDRAGAFCEKKKASFTYQGSSIPSQSNVFVIRNEDDISGFWDDILDFERRISSGERVR